MKMHLQKHQKTQEKSQKTFYLKKEKESLKIQIQKLKYKILP